MNNQDIRIYAKKKGVRLWQIAEKLNLHDSNFSRLLRNELSENIKTKITKIIDEISSDDFIPDINDYMKLMDEGEKQMVLAFAEQILLNQSSDDTGRLEE